MLSRLAEYQVFLREFRRNFHHTGAIAPSSRFLAAALCRYVRSPGACDGSSAPRHVLEVGPGTGAVTQRLVRVLGPEDRFDLVELNTVFVEVLNARFAREPHFQAVAPRSRVLNDRLENLPQAPTYDAIVSGLPLNNFAAADVRQILQAMARMLKPGGVLSFFEYIAVRSARGLVVGKQERGRLREIGRILRETLHGREIRRDAVLLNLPPAWVHHVQFER